MPPQAHGIGVIAAQADAGSDPLGIGFVLHVDLGLPLVPFTIASSVSGSTARALPIPNDVQLVSVWLCAQLAWPWSASCDPSLLNLSSTSGLALTIQP